MNDKWYAPGPCPRCGGKVTIDCDCPGWGSNPVMVCVGCCNATLYECEHGDWWFRTPNRRDTTRYDGVEMGPEPTEWEAKDVMP